MSHNPQWQRNLTDPAADSHDWLMPVDNEAPQGAGFHAARSYHAAGCVVIDAEGRVLVLSRPRRAEWRLPKGHVDPGESAEAAALRETREESGYKDIVLGQDLGEQWVVYVWRERVHRRRETYFLAQLRSVDTMPRPPEDVEQFEVAWLSLAEAAARLSYAAERHVLAKARTAMEGLRSFKGRPAALHGGQR